eukprot:6175286-Pleurochrysis_carterae.AAC.2
MRRGDPGVGLGVEFSRQREGTERLCEKQLHVVRGQRVESAGVEVEQVVRPLRAVHVVKERCEGGGDDHVGIALEADEQRRLGDRGTQAGRAVTRSVLTDVDWRQRAVVAVVAARVGHHPVGRVVVVRVPHVAALASQARAPTQRTAPVAGRHERKSRVVCSKRVADELVVRWVAIRRHVRLLVADFESLQPERRGVAHLRAHAAPGRSVVWRVCKVEQVDRIRHETG